MASFKRGKHPTKYLTVEEVAAIFAHRKSVDILSEVSSSGSADADSFWESSAFDSASENSEDTNADTEFSGSTPAIHSDSEEMPPAKKMKREGSDDNESDESHIDVGRGRGRGRGGRGRGRGGRGRGRGGQGRGRGSRGGHGNNTRRGARGGRGAQCEGDHSCQGDQGCALPSNAVSITVKDNGSLPPVLFCPLRAPGPHVSLTDVSALSLFELIFDDAMVDRILTSTLAYAESKKKKKRKRYNLFMRKKLTKAELYAFLGCLILLSIHKVRNHRKAWSATKAQYLSKLHDLMTCQRFELIGCFLHVVTPEEEDALATNRLKKLQPYLEHIKSNSLTYYQPLQHLSVDERMVKSKCRSHMVQYMRNKPVRWGFKLWVVADTSGYTIDFNIYTGKEESTDHGLTSKVVMDLLEPFWFQGYEVYTDNFYSSPSLFQALLALEIRATGTLRTNRIGVPSAVVAVKRALEKKEAKRGNGYYVRDSSTNIVYVCWRDVKVVTVLSTAYPGHSEATVTRRARLCGKMEKIDVPIPVAVQKYNISMGGVDLSDQYLAYHNVLRRTVRYWKTLFYHGLDIGVVNSFILYNLLAYQAGMRTTTENDFRDMLVLQIIEKYGREKREPVTKGRPPRSAYRVHHGSTLTQEKGRCQYCKLARSGKVNFTQRRCPDCPFAPPLCQTMDRDCHAAWHQSCFDEIRTLWIDKQEYKNLKTSSTATCGSSPPGSLAGPSQTLRATPGRSETPSVSGMEPGHSQTPGTSGMDSGHSETPGTSGMEPGHSQTLSRDMELAAGPSQVSQTIPGSPPVTGSPRSRRGRGRPRGSMNKRRRRGNYKSKK